MPPRKKKPTDIEKPKAIGPYDIVKMMFGDQTMFRTQTNLTLDRNEFMINRICSIKYPVHAQVFNGLNVNRAEVVKVWADFFPKVERGLRAPGWIYSKTSPAPKQEVVERSYTKDDVAEYGRHYHISLQNLSDAAEIDPKGFSDEMMRFKKMMDEKANIEKI